MTSYLKRMAGLCMAVFVIALVCNLGVSFAQESTPPATPWWKMLLDMAVLSVLPALWAAVGPTATAFITKGVNSLSSTYVPRSVQVVLSGMITATLAGLSGDPSGVVQAAVEGASGQILAATPPHVLLTEAPPRG